ncbi:MAG: kelch repeat-containing protein, partial [Fibrobacterota bacterium]
MNEYITAKKTRLHVAVIALVFSATLWPLQSSAQNCWLERVPPAPSLPPFSFDVNSMAYDLNRQVVVLFEFDVNAGATRTLEWDGVHWREKAFGTGPSRREGFQMVYFPTKGVTTLFGGYNAGEDFRETWEWNGFSWTLVSNTGPSARHGHTMAFDPQRGVLVLFGGGGDGLQEDTWEWNGSVWSLKSSTGPSPRYFSAMAHDAARGEMILFGGATGGTVFDDTWKWNGTSWTQLAAPGPSPRAGHAMVYYNGEIFMFGGDGAVGFGAPNNETWVWNGGAWSQLATSGPSRRYHHGMAVDVNRERVVLFGGKTTACSYCYLDDTWEWDGNLWMQPSITPGHQTFFPGLAFDSDRGVTVLFGGSAPGPGVYFSSRT